MMSQMIYLITIKKTILYQHFRERINIYSGEDFDYEIHNVEINNAKKFLKLI